VGCGSNSGSSSSDGPIINEIDLPNKVATNASYMMSVNTEEEADINIIPEQGTINNKKVYDDMIEFSTNSYEGDVSVKVIAENSSGTTTSSKKVKFIETPVTPTYYDLWEDSIGSTNIDITFVNNSTKTVIAFDLKIIGWNNFDERVPTDYLGEDYTVNATVSKTSFSPGESRIYTWKYLDIDFINPITRAKAYVTRIAYEDGSSWNLN